MNCVGRANSPGRPTRWPCWHQPAGIRAKRLAVVGGGKRASFDLRKVGGDGGSRAQRTRGEEPGLVAERRGRRKRRWKAPSSEISKWISIRPRIRVNPWKNSAWSRRANGKDLDEAFERGRILGESQNFARELANEPANILTPLIMAERARAMAIECGPRFRNARSGPHARSSAWDRCWVLRKAAPSRRR